MRRPSLNSLRVAAARLRLDGAALTLCSIVTPVASAVAVVTLSAAPAPSVDAAFASFWSASNVEQAAQRADAVVASGVAFADAYARMRTGRPYGAEVPRGVVKLARRQAGREFPYTLDVPPQYDPRKTYQVRVQLHGGVSRPAPVLRGDGSIGALAGAEQIYVMPQGWNGAQWWTAAQASNIEAILDNVKRTYNVDENRVVLAGVSDGGTGAFYYAMRHSTPFASFLPFNAFILVLRNPTLALDGALFPHNLMNKPVYAVNGGLDPLYPSERVEPFMRQLESGGLRLVYRNRRDAAHNTSWWPQLKDEVEAFVREHPREPHPARLTWRTDDLKAHNRAHWLVIDQFGKSKPERDLPDLNNFTFDEGKDRRVIPLFPSSWWASGRVDLVRDGNVVRASTQGVKAFTLLLSPDVFDFSKPVTVFADGRMVFHGVVPARVDTLMKWAARDNDRTMLYGAEIQVSLPQ